MNHSKAIQEYKERLLQRLGNNLIYAKLFGSVARGTDTPESDIDVLVLVKRKDQFIKDAIFDETVKVNLAHDVVIAPIIIARQEYGVPHFRETGFYKAIDQEGILL